ncbi:hypothetical protein GG804_29315 [Sphingomonas histidinilytica]|nr:MULTISPECIES: hypothetical protein [Sphingomonadaceae]MBO9380860.1 hypothetical protein [Rhizorhabdus histidinilytica]
MIPIHPAGESYVDGVPCVEVVAGDELGVVPHRHVCADAIRANGPVQALLVDTGDRSAMLDCRAGSVGHLTGILPYDLFPGDSLQPHSR